MMLLKRVVKLCSGPPQVTRLVCQGHFSTRASVKESTSQNTIEERDFKPKNVLLMRKITRYEYEKKTSHITNDAELKDYVSFVEIVFKYLKYVIKILFISFKS